MSPSSPPSKDYRKPCTLCTTKRSVLVRCQIDRTGTWHFLCPGTCWRRVSGGVVDGDGVGERKWYRYGGMWKDKHEAVSARMKKGRGRVVVRTEAEGGTGGTGDGGGAGADGADGAEDSGGAEDAEGPDEAEGAEAIDFGSDGSGDGEGVTVDHEEDGDLDGMRRWKGTGEQFSKNDRVKWNTKVWACRKTHSSNEAKPPDIARNLWKELVQSAEFWTPDLKAPDRYARQTPLPRGGKRHA